MFCRSVRITAPGFAMLLLGCVPGPGEALRCEAPLQSADGSAAGCGNPIPTDWLVDYTTSRGSDLSCGAMEVDGKAREYLVELPENYDSERAYPIVFSFHGQGGQMDEAARHEVGSTWGSEVIAIYPQGLLDRNRERTWNFVADGNDQQFFESMVATFESRTCVDDERIFVQGFSRGAAFSHFLSCLRPDLVRAGAAAAGAFPGDISLCSEPVSQFIVHGRNDPTVTLEQGETSRDAWLEINGCTNEAKPVQPDGCVRYDECTGEAEVTWCVHGGRHEPAYDIGFDDDVTAFFRSFE